MTCALTLILWRGRHQARMAWFRWRVKGIASRRRLDLDPTEIAGLAAAMATFRLGTFKVDKVVVNYARSDLLLFERANFPRKR